MLKTFRVALLGFVAVGSFATLAGRAEAGQTQAPREARPCFADNTPVAVSAGNSHPPATVDKLSWLAGTWAGRQGTTAFDERWTPAEGGSMLATARSIRNGRLAAFEFLCIVERGGTLVYSAMPNGRTPPTDFPLVAIDDESATFENPSHDYPQRIRYQRRRSDVLEATISDAEGRKPVTYVFKRQ